MTKTQQRQRKRERLRNPEKHEAKLRARLKRLYPIPELTPEEAAEEARKKAIEDARLAALFGVKDHYSDEEIEIMLDQLHAENAFAPGQPGVITPLARTAGSETEENQR